MGCRVLLAAAVLSPHIYFLPLPLTPGEAAFLGTAQFLFVVRHQHPAVDLAVVFVGVAHLAVVGTDFAAALVDALPVAHLFACYAFDADGLAAPFGRVGVVGDVGDGSGSRYASGFGGRLGGLRHRVGFVPQAPASVHVGAVLDGALHGADGHLQGFSAGGDAGPLLDAGALLPYDGAGGGLLARVVADADDVGSVVAAVGVGAELEASPVVEPCGELLHFLRRDVADVDVYFHCC